MGTAFVILKQKKLGVKVLSQNLIKGLPFFGRLNENELLFNIRQKSLTQYLIEGDASRVTVTSNRAVYKKITHPINHPITQKSQRQLRNYFFSWN